MEHDLNIKTLFTLIYFLSSYPYIKGNLEIMHQHLTDRWAPNQFLSRSTRPSDLITNHCKSILSNLHVRTHEKTPEEFQYLALTTPIWKLLCCAVITSIYHFQFSLKFKCIIFRPIWENHFICFLELKALNQWERCTLIHFKTCLLLFPLYNHLAPNGPPIYPWLIWVHFQGP